MRIAGMIWKTESEREDFIEAVKEAVIRADLIVVYECKRCGCCQYTSGLFCGNCGSGPLVMKIKNA